MLTSRHIGYKFNLLIEPSGVLPSPPVGVRRSPYLGRYTYLNIYQYSVLGKRRSQLLMTTRLLMAVFMNCLKDLFTLYQHS